MKDHKEFMKEAADANALPAKTCRALGPESDADISMYAECVKDVEVGEGER